MPNSDKSMHTLSVYVANKPGALARIAQVFARRGFNIESLVVSPAVDGNFSRMTISCSGDPDGLDQIIKQLLAREYPVIHGNRARLPRHIAGFAPCLMRTIRDDIIRKALAE